MSVKQWMSWDGGVDLVAVTSAGLSMPNVIVHVARMVHTPVGSVSIIIPPAGISGGPAAVWSPSGIYSR